MTGVIEKTKRQVVIWVIGVAVVIAALSIWSFVSSLQTTFGVTPENEEVPFEVELQ